MKNTFGSAISLTLFGESHGPAIGAVLDGLAPGIEIDQKYIEDCLAKRRSYKEISTARREPDQIEFLSGVFGGKTTGTPLCLIIRNQDTKSKDYEKTKGLARPSHADLTANYKYEGFQDYRGGGHFSGRVTAALVAACAILKKALEHKGIYVFSHIKSCMGIEDRDFLDYAKDQEALKNMLFAVLDEKSAEAMRAAIAKASSEGDSLGGILETAVTGLPAGAGEPWFDTVEGVISHAVFSVPAVKGIEFGAGFRVGAMKGSQANDAMRYQGDKVVTLTNNNGGINGGITNGMPVIFRTAVKPTPSIFIEQETVDFEKKENAHLKLEGRHDPAIVHRAAAVIDAVTAFALADLLTVKYGTNFLAGDDK